MLRHVESLDMPLVAVMHFISRASPNGLHNAMRELFSCLLQPYMFHFEKLRNYSVIN